MIIFMPCSPDWHTIKFRPASAVMMTDNYLRRSPDLLKQGEVELKVESWTRQFIMPGANDCVVYLQPTPPWKIACACGNAGRPKPLATTMRPCSQAEKEKRRRSPTPNLLFTILWRMSFPRRTDAFYLIELIAPWMGDGCFCRGMPILGGLM